jgi:threonine dehydratase
MVAGLPPDVRARGLVTHSSGNHGRAVAYAARTFGVGAVVVVPEGAPAVKLDAMRALGAELVVVDPAERLARAERLVAEHGYAFVPPYDAREIIAGQGTVGREIAADWPEVGTVLVPVGGGGLASGVAVAVKALLPQARVVGVEPELAADAHESLRAGELVRWPTELRYRTVADGVRTDLSELTFAHLSAYVDDIVTVSESEIGAAMGVLAREARLVAEPSGALTTAAYLYHAAELPPGPYAAVVSGGNVDMPLFGSWIVNP